MINEFTFFIPTKIHFGTSALDSLVREVKEAGYKRLGLVYDRNLSGHELLDGLVRNLESITETVGAPVTFSEPTYSDLDRYCQAFRGTEIQAVVGVGGGSVLDTAKAVAVLMHNKGPAIAYRGFDRMTEPVLPVYAVPTTAGTGSEITPNASFVDDESKKKLGINGEAIRPKGAYLHPGFIITCPEKPAAYAAMDALVHAVEAYAAKKANHVARMFGREAVRLVLGNMVDAVKSRQPDAIEQVFMGSLLAGMAMMHSGTGPAAAFSYPLGVHHRIPHGLAGGIFLPHVMRWNIEHGYYGYADLLESHVSGDVKERALYVLNRVSDVWNTLDIPQKAGEIGLTESDIPIFLSDLEELRGAIEQNPVNITDKDLRDMLDAHICQ
jgi:alcohol dehydrogenase